MKIKFILVIFNLKILAIWGQENSNNFLTFHFNKREIISFDDYYQEIGPFKKNSITSLSILYNKQISKIKKFNLNFQMGLNSRFQTVGYPKSTNIVPSVTTDIKCNSFLLGLQSGISIERKIYHIKNTNIILGLGVTGSGIFFNTAKEESFAFDMHGSFGKDSVVVYFQQNRLFYVNPYYQIRFISPIKNKKFIYGLRYLIATSFTETNIRYAFFDTRFTNTYKYKGGFLDSRNQFEFFLGITL